MTEPEIARRCPTCGASIRESAFFCPQCGKELPERGSRKAQAQRLDETIAESPAPVGDPKVELGMETLRETPASLSTEPLRRPESESQTPEIKAQEKSAADGPAVDAARASMGQAALGAVGAKIHRATTLARNVEGDVVHRVKKVKEISSVVLDEAGYDPSLRFVLVAAVLFLLFLLIVILNKFIY